MNAIQHPAYPSPAAVRRHSAAARLAHTTHATNARAHAILSRALAEIEALDPPGFCMARGYDWRDLALNLKDMLPQLDGDMGARLDEWASEQCEGVV